MNILIMSQKGDCDALAKLAADQGNSVRVWCQADTPLELFTIDGVQVIGSWARALKWAEVAIFDREDISRYYKTVSRHLPIVGGGEGVHLLLPRQGDVYYRLGIPTMPAAHGERRITWGTYSDRWAYVGGDQRGSAILDKLSPYLSFINYKGPFAIQWTRRRFSNFLIDSGMRMGYDLWVSRERTIPVEMELKEIIQGWR